MTNFSESLNPSQKQAAFFLGGHLLIVAGPGTGKTHTLTFRIAETIEILKPHEEVLAITFTNKAADEMRQRLKQRLDRKQERCFIGTFHQFCLSLLRDYKKETIWEDDFNVASPEDVEEVIKSLWPELNRRSRKVKMEYISQWKSTYFRQAIPNDLIEYNNFLRTKKLLDFDDILLEALKLLEDHEDILKKVRACFKHVFVDEYQDINTIQHELLKILVQGDVTLTAIGDPNQAIYGFRGSQIKFFESFTQDFPDATTLTLSDNYRSSKNLLSASGQVMEKGDSVHVPELTANIIADGRLTVHQALTDKAEAEYVVHTIEKLVGGTSMFSQDSGRVDHSHLSEVSFGDIACLYRLNSQSILLKEAFERSGIPYHISKSKAKDVQDDVCPPRDEDVDVQAERVSLMSIHAAKGLEFPVVFMVGCEEKFLPLDLEGLVSDVQEERRLFYVGMTRAKYMLYLLHAKRRRIYGKVYSNAPSPFLLDIEEKLKEQEIAKTRKRKKQQQMSLFKI